MFAASDRLMRMLFGSYKTLIVIITHEIDTCQAFQIVKATEGLELLIYIKIE